MSDTEVIGMAVEIEPSCQQPYFFQIAAERHSSKIVTGMKLYKNQRCVIEFLNVEEIDPLALISTETK